jgi:hypothetical protein
MKRPLMGLAALMVVAGEASAAVPLDDAQLDALSGAAFGPNLGPATIPVAAGGLYLPSDQIQTVNLITIAVPRHVTAAVSRLGFGAIVAPW